jgi:hypothetical protein
MAGNKSTDAGGRSVKDAGFTSCVAEVFDVLSALPPELRAQHALMLSAQLVEFAAFEMAGKLTSDRVGELINCAADLDDCALEVGASDCFSTRGRAGVLQ